MSYRRYMMSRANKLICGIDLSGQPDNELWYVTTDDEKTDSSNLNLIGTWGKQAGLQIVSHTYENGLGKVQYNMPLERLGENVFQHPQNTRLVSLPRTLTGFSAYSFCYGYKTRIDLVLLSHKNMDIFHSSYRPTLRTLYVQSGCAQYYEGLGYNIIEKNI